MLKQRVLTALLLAPLAIAAVLLLSTEHWALLLAGVCAVGLLEWSRLIGLRLIYWRIALVAVNLVLMSLLWEYREHDALLYALVVGAAWWMVAPMWLRHHSFAQAPRKRFLTLKAIAGTLAVVPAWAACVMLHSIPDTGPYWVLFVVVLIWCADTGAYFAGKKFGHRKLAPNISPGKTTAGVYGALVGCAIFAVVGGLVLQALGGFDHASVGWALATLVVLALVTVAFSIVGDLFESLIKRHSGAKDSGTLFPGHGGVFDRLDSLFAALPVFTAGKLLAGL